MSGPQWVPTPDELGLSLPAPSDEAVALTEQILQEKMEAVYGFTDGMDTCKRCRKLREYKALNREGICDNRWECNRNIEELERWRKRS